MLIQMRRKYKICYLWLSLHGYKSFFNTFEEMADFLQ